MIILKHTICRGKTPRHQEQRVLHTAKPPEVFQGALLYIH